MCYLYVAKFRFYILNTDIPVSVSVKKNLYMSGGFCLIATIKFEVPILIIINEDVKQAPSYHIFTNNQYERTRKKNLKADNKLFLFINIKIIELIKLVAEDPDEPSLKAEIGPRSRFWKITIGIDRWNRRRIVNRDLSAAGGGGGYLLLKELLQRLVA